jgi:splicing factor 45
MKFTQINLHHSKAATAVLCQQLAKGMADAALIQEPWIYRGQIRGLTNSGGTIFSVAPEGNARSCIYTRNQINALPLLELCSRDVTAVRMTNTCGGRWEELFVASAYLPCDLDKPPPTKKVREVIDYCTSRKKQLIIGCDANEHHILWGSTDTNTRGEAHGISGEFEPEYS